MNNANTFYFCTDTFTLVQCEFLAELMYKKLKIKATVNKRTTTVNSKTTIMWRIRISTYSVPLFRQLVTPDLLPIFYYKLGNIK